jgi:hypothetical protein
MLPGDGKQSAADFPGLLLEVAAMPQIFHRSFNTISKVSIFGFLFFLAGLAWVLAEINRSAYATDVNVAINQPVPFSHQHHVSGLGIDCRYCHTSVEKSAFAGIPPTKTCMNCHSQIWSHSPLLRPVRESYRSNRSLPWNRVHNLPGFVYFDHSIHVNKGVGCASCHGRVDQMPLTWKVNTLLMEWCIDCHRQPEEHIRPRDKIFDMAWEPPDDQLRQARKLMQEEYRIDKVVLKRLTDCSTCHR